MHVRRAQAQNRKEKGEKQMKASQVLRILFAAVLILTSLPVTSSADEEYHQSYHNFHITGDAPEGTNGLWFNDETKTYTLESRPDGGFYNVTLSGQATGEGTYCNFVVAAKAKANITLDNVEIRIPSGAASLTTAITVDWGSEVNIYLKGKNVLTSAKSAGLSIYGYARIFEAEDGGSLYVSSSYHNAGIRVPIILERN